MAKGTPIGLTMLHYAVMLTDVVAEGATPGTTTYDTPVRLPGAISANFSPNASNDTLFADDGPYDVASTLGAMTLELNVADIGSKHSSILLGAGYNDTTGVLVQTSEDIPPFVAIGMSVKKSNGADRLLWYMKGKFSAPDENNQTKADSINWNTPTISGNFAKRDSDNVYKAQVDTDDPNISAAVKNAWFTDPNTFKAAAVVASPPPTSATIAVGGTDLTVTLPVVPVVGDEIFVYTEATGGTLQQTFDIATTTLSQNLTLTVAATTDMYVSYKAAGKSESTRTVATLA